MSEQTEGPRILALCAGYGGLEIAAHRLIGGTVVAFAENDPYAAAVFSHHHPGVPNLGDIAAVDWAAVLEEYRPDVITAGWPCRNISNAGDRSGIDGQWSKVWKHVAEAVGVVRPRLVLMENVAALTRRGLPRVLGDLAGHGYDARWTCVRASETVDACHSRYRWFGIAHPASDPDIGRWHRGAGDVAEPDWRGEPAHGGDASAGPGGLSLLPTPLARSWKGANPNPRGADLNHVLINLLPTPKASDGPHGGPNQRDTAGNFYLPGVAVRLDGDTWKASNGKDYGPAVQRWEWVTGRPAPCPTEPGTRGNHRLSPAFEEWMMGLPDGHVTAVPDIPRREQMRIIGNGVVWQQAVHAYEYLMTSEDFTITEEDDMSNRAEELSDGTEQQPDKPRGDCTGCKFNYQLGTARSGEFKGELVIRKHNSRTGPGLCEGSQRPPKGAETEEPACCEPCAGAETLVFDDARVDLPTGVTITVDGAIQQAEAWRGVPFTAPDPHEREATSAIAAVTAMTTAATPPDPFMSPAQMPAELPAVSGQPEPDRDRWSRYLIHGQAHTRATTFTKAGSSTFSLNEWQQRMVVLGLTQRRDLLAMAHGLDVKRDRKQLNQIAEDAKNAAGSKVAANLGTALHAFSERLDAGLMNVADVPPEYQQRMMEYLRTIENAGLTTRPEWIERTTAVRADQVSALLPVAGTLDRIFQLPNGELVIGDLKTGSDLSYGWGEIATQLAVYAHGVNTHGLFDWRTKTWESRISSEQPTGVLRVRTDYGIVMHLPASGEGCTLYRVDLDKGWERAQVCGQVMGIQKDKDGFAMPLTVDALPGPLDTPPGPETGEVAQHRSDWNHATRVFSEADSRARIAELYQYAMDSGRFTDQQLGTLAAIGAERLAALQPA